MKILHISASYKPAYIYGGPVMSVAKLCEEMESSESFISITVYTTLANGKEELPYKSGNEKIVDGIKVKYFKRITKDHSHFSPTLLWHLWKTVKQYDIIHIHAWWNLVTMPACFIAYLRGVKVVLSPRGTLSAYSFDTDKSLLKHLFHQLIGKRLLNSCFIHATSSKELIDSLQLLSPKMVVNIPNFVAFPEKNKEERTKKKEDVSIRVYLDADINMQDDKVLKIIFLSRIEEKKGLELLFDSLNQVDFPWELSIVGEGEKDYVEELKRKIGRPETEDRIMKAKDEMRKVEGGNMELIGDQVNWLGPIYGEQKFELLSQHDLFVLPSFDENFANVVIESLYCGTPVLLSKNVGLSDYVEQNNLGWICERNQEQLTLTLNQAYEDLKNQSFKVDSISDKVREDFEDSKITDQYISFYQSVYRAGKN